MSDTKIFIGGLWLNETKDGTKYFSGGLGVGGKLLIFRNDHKVKDADPDYKMYLVPKAEIRDAPPEQESLPF